MVSVVLVDGESEDCGAGFGREETMEVEATTRKFREDSCSQSNPCID